MEEVFTPRQTVEWFDQLKPSVKDMVCRLYMYIERHSKTKDYINFSKEGITYAAATVSLTGYPSERFVERFHSNLDIIKDLVQALPTKTYVYWDLNLDEGDKPNSCRFQHHTFRYYDSSKLNSMVQHERNDWSAPYARKWQNYQEIINS